MKTEMYVAAIRAALEIQQKQIEIQKLLRVMAGSLTAAEVVKRDFDRGHSVNALLILRDELGLKKEDYVKGSVNYKDVVVNLHQDPEKPNSGFMKSILEGVDTKHILNC